ncbi:DUF4164 domain-containing protein [Breoghania sp.]|uniref:DUF4164 domain-containing protein n=1 Tax=Breoghania sp. TaxID=2065378 RepID=UPI002AA7A9F5|nr:DUF4164 domain-containing protein [Breoghania sp.]
MNQASKLDAAFQRLSASIGQLEAAVNRRMASEKTVGALQDELQRLNEDRARLAETLDGAESRSDRLEQANKEVSRRLVSAMESIRTVLESHGG